MKASEISVDPTDKEIVLRIKLAQGKNLAFQFTQEAFERIKAQIISQN
jgi:hypothetical protein